MIVLEHWRVQLTGPENLKTTICDTASCEDSGGGLTSGLRRPARSRDEKLDSTVYYARLQDES